jgi:hypothetical protein
VKGTANEPRRNYVFVYGFDYFFDNNDFSSYCRKRWAQLRSRAKFVATRLYEIDCYKRRIQVTDAGSDGKPGTPSVLERKDKSPLSSKDFEKRPKYQHRSLKPGVPSISALDVYELVKRIGREEPQTLHELSFFSHGINEGPVLVNTFDSIPLQTRRDNFDHDMRAAKDFVPPTTTPSGLKEMHAAFAESGIMWLWGCNRRPEFRSLFEAANKAFKGPRDREQLVVIDDTKYEKPEVPKKLAELLYPIAGTIDPQKKIRFKTTVNDLCRVIFAEIQSTYAFQAALHLRVPVYAAPVGAEAAIKEEMSVREALDYVKGIVSFYNKFFRFEWDPEGYQYLKHTWDMDKLLD